MMMNYCTFLRLLSLFVLLPHFASADAPLPYYAVTDLGTLPGAVGFLSLVKDGARAVRFALERSLWEAERVTSHPLRNTATVSLTQAEFRAVLADLGVEPLLIPATSARATSRRLRAGPPSRSSAVAARGPAEHGMGRDRSRPVCQTSRAGMTSLPPRRQTRWISSPNPVSSPTPPFPSRGPGRNSSSASATCGGTSSSSAPSTS